MSVNDTLKRFIWKKACSAEGDVAAAQWIETEIESSAVEWGLAVVTAWTQWV